MTQLVLHHGDCRQVLREMIARGEKVHSVVTDPPYHLESIVKRFGKSGAAPAKFGSDGAFARASKGFMGKTWDGADEDGSRIAQDAEFWSLIYDVLLPGGFVLAFSSPRTGHWQACAMETAGFVMHPFIGWAYGQGFPKAHNAARAIDQALGVEPKVVGHVKRRDIRNGQGEEYGANAMSASNRADGPKYIDVAVTAPGSKEADAWDGWSYGAQAMKPALEPIYVGQKPFSEKNGALNLLKHGVGALNTQGCRVESTDEDQEGRWPANLVHDGSVSVVAMFPDAPGQKAGVGPENGPKGALNCYNPWGERAEHQPRGDSGSAARFFNAFPLDETGELWACDLDDNPVIYAPKASSKDRVVKCAACGQRYHGKRSCACVGEDGKPAKTESHPTVKPIGLMRWLCRLITPPGGTVLDPFAGSGTTGRAALDEGFSAVLIEREPEYADDIRFRFGLTKPLPREILDLLDGPQHMGAETMQTTSEHPPDEVLELIG